MYFTYVIVKIFEKFMYKGLILWVDDFLLYGETVEELFDLARWVFEKAKVAA